MKGCHSWHRSGSYSQLLPPVLSLWGIQLLQNRLSAQGNPKESFPIWYAEFTWSSSKGALKLVVLVELHLLSIWYDWHQMIQEKISPFQKLWHQIHFEVTHNTVSARNHSKSVCTSGTWFLNYNNMFLNLVGTEAEIMPRHCRWSWLKISFSTGSVPRLMLTFLPHLQWWILTLKCFMEGKSFNLCSFFLFQEIHI